MERLLSQITQQALRQESQVAAAVLSGEVSRGKAVSPTQACIYWGSPGNILLDPDQLRWWNSTAAITQVHSIYASYDSLVERTINYRGTRVLLALADWRREHGELPDALNVLVGPYFGQLPVDPLTREPFPYFPHGLAQDIPAQGGGRYGPLAKGRPFLWSPGRHSRLTVRRLAQDQWEICDPLGHIVSAAVALPQGRVWPVPLPTDDGHMGARTDPQPGMPE
jgi:hypothetical protein